ncbi:protease pro-enzyme activation domain-containing protein [Motilibacter peucedani]|uniref:protease pro-enzyme activation domain-containing protein n=1 Tax=Motilibacter peucedani TaxID=598650 RepID=UPI001602EF83|nr:protease pro-enzyme activation domain-containing protein [Motilibacter peucedani]
MTGSLAALAAFALGVTPAVASAATSPSADGPGGSAAPTVPTSAAFPTHQRGSAPQAVTSGSAHLVRATDESQRLRLTVGLQTPHADDEEAFLASLQDKSSPNFHRYLTAEQWNARFAPSAADEQKVVDWAQANGITVTRRFANHLVVDLEGDVGTVEKALGVSINDYTLGQRQFYANTAAPALPASISDVVEAVGGLNSLEVLQPQGATAEQEASTAYSAGAAVSEGPSQHADGSTALLAAAMSAAKAKSATTGGFYDPSDIYASTAYDTDALNRQGHCCNPTHVSTGAPPATSIAIASVGLQQLSDMQGFHDLYPYLAYSYDTRYIDGTPSGNDLEGTMDLEWSTAMANSFGSYLDTAHVRMYDGANALLTTFTDIYNSMLSDGVARTMSTSWGCAESYCASSGLMNTQHNIFNAMLGQGWSLTAASDDAGPYADCSHVSVSYPSSDPDVVAAGGTTLQAAGGFFSEVAWTGGSSAGSCGVNNGGGGGGCSVQFAQPGYQSGRVNGLCPGHRAVPDVSLNASIGQNIFFGGVRRGSGGTSIVAPELAGFFAQANAYRISMGNICGSTGNQACGLIGNPNNAIYLGASTGTTHNPVYDITSGCTSNDVGGGWCAGTGYDLATGLGSLNMLQLAWDINYWTVPEATPPSIGISGPSTGVWYTSNPSLSWSVADSGGSYGAAGNAGYTYRWDADPGNPTSHAHPGTGDPFYYGPTYPKASTGSVSLASAGQGCHTLYVRAWDNLGLSTLRSYGPVCYDTSTPSASISLNSGATYANSSTVSVALSASNPTSGDPVTQMRFSNNGGSSYGPWHPYASSTTYGLPSGNGTRSLSVQVMNAAGTVSAGATDTIVVDTAVPTISSAPHPKLITGQTFTSSGAPVQILWSGSDTGGSGISGYTLQQSVDGGAYTGVSLSSPGATSAIVHIHSGHTYRYQVRVTDRAGNVSGWKAGSTFTLSSYENTSSRIAYSSGWTQVNESGASGGNVKYTTSGGKTAKVSFTGTQVAWVTQIASTNGSATVKVDSGSSSSVSTNGSTTKQTYVAAASTGLTAGAHTYTVTSSGTSGHPRVEVDTFLVIS